MVTAFGQLKDPGLKERGKLLREKFPQLVAPPNETEEQHKTRMQDWRTIPEAGIFHFLDRLQKKKIEKCRLSDDWMLRGERGMLGRMMQICITSRMFAEGAVNSKQIANTVLKCVPDAKCLIVSGRGM
jgi:hypothetical protein